MIDIHSHILPGIDDGSRDIYDTLEMAKMAVDSGVTEIVVTPHCNVPDLYDNYYGKKYKETFLMAKKSIKEEGIPLELYPGMEIFTTENLIHLLASGKIITMNGSHYMLVEFDFGEDPDFANMMLSKIAAVKLIPLVAHVERYEFVQDDLNIIRQWRKKGYQIQINKDSYLGKFGRREEKTAYMLTDESLVTAIASDAHRPYRRTPDMSEAYEELLNYYPEQYLEKLFTINPMKIRKDLPIEF